MGEKLLLVTNPRAGREKAKVILLDLIRIFTESGKDVTVYPTLHKESTITYIKNNAPNYDLVVTCGGDGTLNETINAIMQCGKRVPIGYIPLGSTNDFAASLDIPTDCMQAAEKIIQGTRFHTTSAASTVDTSRISPARALCRDLVHDQPKPEK
jgi:diacylglycerol kinase family enzyme